MATDATGTPTSNGIPTYQTSLDAPSGRGFNAAMAVIDTLITTALKGVFKKSGVTIGTRRGLNFVEGANVILTVADDAGNDAVNVTIAAAASASTFNQAGLLSARPAASVGSGTKYFATDQVVEYISDGTNWTRVGLPAGATIDWHKPDAAVPTGWVAYDSTALPSSTGIYADLYAHLGNTTTTPDTRGRVTVGKGTHADVDAIGDNDGIATVASRRPKHKHTVTDPGHVHTESQAVTTGAGSGSSGALAVAGSGNTGSATTGITVGPQTGSEPTDGSAWITVLKIAKL